MKASGRRFLASVEEAQVTSCELLVDLNFSQPAIACLLRLWHCQNNTHLFYRARFIVDMVLTVFGKITRKKKGEFEPPACIRSKRDTKFRGFSPLTFFSNFFFHPHGICPFQGFRGYSYCKLLQKFQRLPLTRTNLVQLRTKEIKTRDERGQRFCGD